MSLGNGLHDIRRDKPDRPGSIEPNDVSYFGLARFDTRHSSVNKYNYENSNPQYKKPYEPDRILEGQPVLECIFCNKYRTAIAFDMELHLHEKHRWELLREFPIKEKGYSMDVRAEYFVYQMKIKGEKLERIKDIQATAQATDMKKLINPTTTAAAIDNHQSIDNDYHTS